MTSIADILTAVFTSEPCDFCPAENRLTYTDPETGCRYCLPCLVLSTQEWKEAEWKELPPDPAIMQMGREIIAVPR